MCFHVLICFVCFLPFHLPLPPPQLARPKKTSAVSIRSPDKFIFLPPHLSLPLCLRPSLHLAHSPFFFLFSFLFWLPHFLTSISPLLSPRTLATRTVMSSMRSWILQLWPPLPAHEALLTLAQGILSSMQPSSLAHTSACQFRAFPPQTLASRYTD